MTDKYCVSFMNTSLLLLFDLKKQNRFQLNRSEINQSRLCVPERQRHFLTATCFFSYLMTHLITSVHLHHLSHMSWTQRELQVVLCDLWPLNQSHDVKSSKMSTWTSGERQNNIHANRHMMLSVCVCVWRATADFSEFLPKWHKQEEEEKPAFLCQPFSLPLSPGGLLSAGRGVRSSRYIVTHPSSSSLLLLDSCSRCLLLSTVTNKLCVAVC